MGRPVFYLATLSTMPAPIDLLEQNSDMKASTGSFSSASCLPYAGGHSIVFLCAGFTCAYIPNNCAQSEEGTCHTETE